MGLSMRGNMAEQVRDLDRIVKTLRKHRSDCAAAMEADQKHIRDIELQVSSEK